MLEKSNIRATNRNALTVFQKCSANLLSSFSFVSRTINKLVTRKVNTGNHVNYRLV